ncbi:hypothetical protein ABZ260_03950 [Streptosporangium sp. NPDC006013]
MEFGDTRPEFVIEGGRGSTPFLVAYAGPGRAEKRSLVGNDVQ